MLEKNQMGVRLHLGVPKDHDGRVETCSERLK